MTVANGTVQNDKVSSKYIILVLHKTNPDIRRVPVSLEYKGGKAFERLREICTDDKCCLRSEADRKVAEEDGDVSQHDEAMEIDKDHQGTSLLQSMLQAEEEDDEQRDGGGDADAADALAAAIEGQEQDDGEPDLLQARKKKRYTLYAYTNSHSYYEVAQTDVGRASGAAITVILTTTAHPSSWYVAQKNCPKVAVYLDKVKSHGVAHGKRLFFRMVLQTKMKQDTIAQSRKRILMHDDGNLIAGPTLDMKSQVLSAYEISVDSGWCNGLNKVSWNPDALQDFSKKQVSKELDWNIVGLTAARASIGRGLVALRAFNEGDAVLSLTALFFDQQECFKRFIKDNGYFYNKTVVVKNVKTAEGEPRRVYCVLVGVGQNLKNSILTRRRHNCSIEFEPSCGFNNSDSPSTNGCLRLVARAGNRSGIAPGAELCVKDGFNMDDAAMTESPAKRFKGAMDEFLDEWREKAAAGQTPEKETNREEQKQAEESSDARVGKENAPDKGDVLVTEFKTPFAMELHMALKSSPPSVQILSMCEANKKIPKDFIFKKYTEFKLVKMEGVAPQDKESTICYDVACTSNIVYVEREQRSMPLKKFLKDAPEVKSVYGYNQWVGAVPPTLKLKKAFALIAEPELLVLSKLCDALRQESSAMLH